MRQWYPLSGSARPGSSWDWEAAAPAVADADDGEYAGHGWEPETWEAPAAGYARGAQASPVLPVLTDYGTQTGYAVPAPRRESVPPAFSQRFCEVSRVTEGGKLQPGMPWAEFIVRVVGGRLTVVEAPVIPVFSVPADEVHITTPRWQRQIGTSSTLRVAGQLWSVQFSRVYLAENAHAGLGGFARRVFSSGASQKAIHRGREINARFTATLLAAGAADTSE